MRKSSFTRSDEKPNSNNQLALFEEQDKGMDGVPQLTKKFYDAISQHSVNTNSKVIEGIISIFQNIITNPYDDKARIADYMHYNSSKLFSYPSCIQYLRDLGFVEGKKEKQLLFPYDLPIAKLIRAKEALSKIHEERIEEIQLLDVEQKTQFPYFQRYCHTLGANLIMKHAKNERQHLQIGMDETTKIYASTKASSLEEMIVEFMSDPKGFQDFVYSSFVSQQKATEFIKLLTELWLETNVLRKFGIYIVQCFSDSISRAELHLPHEPDSKIARQILMIDLLQAQGIVKHSQKQIKSMEDIVRVFLIRNRLETEENARKYEKEFDSFQALDLLLERSMLSRNKVNSFWQNVEDTIVERVSGKARKSRPLLDIKQYQKWCSMIPPVFEPSDLPSYAKERLAYYAAEIFNIDISRGLESLYELEPKERDAKLKKLRDLIWEPKIWLHQKDLIDDYIIYTAVRDLCDHAGVDIALDIRKEFRDFIKGGMPILELPENDKSTTLFQHSAFKNLRKSTEYLTKRPQSLAIGTSQVDVDFEDKSDSWLILYRRTTPAILHACVINRHHELLREFLNKGAFVNIRDHKKWTPLHCAAMIGNVETVKLLLDYKADLEAEDENGRTPFKIAIEYGNYFGELSACSVMLERGLSINEDVWTMLLMYSLENDITCYVKLAHKNRIFLHNVDDTNKFSLHLAVRFQAVNIIKTMMHIIDANTLRAFANAIDLDGRGALDWAFETQNEEVIELVRRIVGAPKQNTVPMIMAQQDERLADNENSLKFTIERLIEENNLRESLMNLSKLKNAENKKMMNSYLQDQEQRELEEEHQEAKRYFENADDYAKQALQKAEYMSEKKQPISGKRYNRVVVDEDEDYGQSPPNLIQLVKNRLDNSQELSQRQQEMPWTSGTYNPRMMESEDMKQTREIISRKEMEIDTLKDELNRQAQVIEDMREQLKEHLEYSRKQTQLLSQTQYILQNQVETRKKDIDYEKEQERLNRELQEKLRLETDKNDEEIQRLRQDLEKVTSQMNSNVQKLNYELSAKQQELSEIRKEKDLELKRLQEEIRRQQLELQRQKEEAMKQVTCAKCGGIHDSGPNQNHDQSPMKVQQPQTLPNKQNLPIEDQKDAPQQKPPTDYQVQNRNILKPSTEYILPAKNQTVSLNENLSLNDSQPDYESQEDPSIGQPVNPSPQNQPVQNPSQMNPNLNQVNQKPVVQNHQQAYDEDDDELPYDSQEFSQASGLQPMSNLQSPMGQSQQQRPLMGGQGQQQMQNPNYGGMSQNPNYGGQQQQQNPNYVGQPQQQNYGGQPQQQNPNYGGQPQQQNPNYGGMPQNQQYSGQNSGQSPMQSQGINSGAQSQYTENENWSLVSNTNAGNAQAKSATNRQKSSACVIF